MFEKLKEYGVYMLLGIITLGALAYSYVQTSNSQKGAEIHEANLNAMVANMSKSEKLKKNSTVAEELLSTTGGKTVGQYRIDDSKVSYVIGETYDEIFNNKRTIDIASSFDDIEEGKIRTILIANPATQINGEDVNVVNLNNDKTLSYGENTITQENFQSVANELKGYNVSAIGYGIFANEQEAKDFRDNYFSSYEIYEVGNTGKFILLTEYNTTGTTKNLGTKINSNVGGLSGGIGEDGCNEYLCLDENGVTMKAKSETTCGNEYEYAGNNYYVACNKNDLIDALNSYASNRIITTKVTDMSHLFMMHINSYNMQVISETQRGTNNDSYSIPGYLIDNLLNNNFYYGYGSDYIYKTQLHNAGDGCTDNSSQSGNFYTFNTTCHYVSSYADQRRWYNDTYDEDLNIKNFNGDISNWDVSNVTNMQGMFYGNGKFNGNISKWNVSNVTNMSHMFFSSVFNGDISNWNVSNVANMESMFTNSQFTGDISNWNVSNVTNLDRFIGQSLSERFEGFDWGGITTPMISPGDDYKASYFANINGFNQNLSSWNLTKLNELFENSNRNNNCLGKCNCCDIFPREFCYETSNAPEIYEKHLNSR